MRTYTPVDLEKILGEHKKWLASTGGTRANLSGADLSRANLSGASLSGADMSRADLSRANLSGANLSGADLSRANLSGASLSRANLSGADLSRADLYGASLSGADLSGAKNIPPVLIQPEEGGFFAWKKLCGAEGGLIAKLWVPAEARHINSFTSRKCRAEYVEVVSIVTMDGVAVGQGSSPTHDKKLTYVVGQAVKAEEYDHDFTRDCAGGIHYFMTRREAEEWGL